MSDFIAEVLRAFGQLLLQIAMLVSPRYDAWGVPVLL